MRYNCKYGTPPPPEYRPSGLPRRKTRLPARYRDVLPPPSPAIIQPISNHGTPSGTTTPTYTSQANSFGIYRVYTNGAPSYTPDDDFNIENVTDNPNFLQSSNPRTAPSSIPFDISPSRAPLDGLESVNSLSLHRFENSSIFRLMLWHHNGAITKSLNDLNVLVQNVICAPDFQVDHFKHFDATKVLDRVFKQGDASTSEKPLNDGWYESSVPISLACDKITHKSERDAPTLNITGLYHRRPLDIIKAALRESNAQQFHIAPFEEYWVPHLDGQPERLYSDLYNSDAYLQEQAVVRNRIHEDSLETVIISMMLWSDSTHLTSFGNASLWPIYLYFGNQSKYDRAKPTTFSAHHLAYIPEVSILFMRCFVPSDTSQQA